MMMHLHFWHLLFKSNITDDLSKNIYIDKYIMLYGMFYYVWFISGVSSEDKHE